MQGPHAGGRRWAEPASPDGPALGLEDSPAVSTSPATGAWPPGIFLKMPRGSPGAPVFQVGAQSLGPPAASTSRGREGFVGYGCHGRLGWETAARQQKGIRAWAADMSRTHHLRRTRTQSRAGGGGRKEGQGRLGDQLGGGSPSPCEVGTTVHTLRDINKGNV